MKIQPEDLQIYKKNTKAKKNGWIEIKIRQICIRNKCTKLFISKLSKEMNLQKVLKRGWTSLKIKQNPELNFQETINFRKSLKEVIV
jgi:hypothetical protein